MVDKNTKISELFKTDKNAINVFKKFDLACPGCRGQAQDTIAKVAVNNGLDPQKLIHALNGK